MPIISQDTVVPVTDPDIGVLLNYLETRVEPYKAQLRQWWFGRLTGQALPNPVTLTEVEAVYQAALLAEPPPDVRRALDIWHDYRHATPFCIRLWQEWQCAQEQRHGQTITRINVLGLWQICAGITRPAILSVPILPHVDRLVWSLAHLLDDAVDAAPAICPVLPVDSLAGIVHTLGVICEIASPGGRERIRQRYRQFEKNYLIHQSRFQPHLSLIDQLAHKLVPNTITADFYSEAIKDLVPEHFDVEEAKRAMSDAMCVWQTVDDMVDFETDRKANVANIVITCLEQTGELKELVRQPCITADLYAAHLPQTSEMLRQVFSMLSRRLLSYRPEVLTFLYADLCRVYPTESLWLLKLNMA